MKQIKIFRKCTMFYILILFTNKKTFFSYNGFVELFTNLTNQKKIQIQMNQMN